MSQNYGAAQCWLTHTQQVFVFSWQYYFTTLTTCTTDWQVRDCPWTSRPPTIGSYCTICPQPSPCHLITCTWPCHSQFPSSALYIQECLQVGIVYKENNMTRHHWWCRSLGHHSSCRENWFRFQSWKFDCSALLFLQAASWHFILTGECRFLMKNIMSILWFSLFPPWQNVTLKWKSSISQVNNSALNLNDKTTSLI